MEEGYETIYYLQSRDGKRKFAVIKFYPQIVRFNTYKTIRSGNFQFAISDESRLKELVDKAEERLKDVVRVANLRRKVLGIVYDLIAEALIDGLTFEINVEEALYLANLLAKYVDEDYEILRETRGWMMQKQSDSMDKDPSIS